MISDIKSIFLNNVNKLIFFRANSQTKKGMYRRHGPYFLLEIPQSETDLGKQIIQTFSECKVGIPHPEDLTKPSVLEKADPYSQSDEAKLLKKLKKTQKDKRLGINFDGIIYTFFPYKVLNKNAAEGIKGVSLTSDADPENLGRTLLEAFELCE